MDTYVNLQVHDGIAVLELNRPQAGNALDLELGRALGEAVAAVADDPSARCLLMRGAGERFCVGGDVAAMASAPDRGAFIGELADLAHRAVLGLASLEIPVVALVQGAAAGAGLALTLFADLVVAADSAVFLTAYAGVGLSPDCGTTWMLPQLVGVQRARQMLLKGRRLSAPEALEWGLVSQVESADLLLETGMHLAGELASAPKPATGLTAKLVRGDLRGLAHHLDREAAAIVEAATSAAAAPLIDGFAPGAVKQRPRSI